MNQEHYLTSTTSLKDRQELDELVIELAQHIKDTQNWEDARYLVLSFMWEFNNKLTNEIIDLLKLYNTPYMG